MSSLGRGPHLKLWKVRLGKVRWHNNILLIKTLHSYLFNSAFPKTKMANWGYWIWCLDHFSLFCTCNCVFVPLKKFSNCSGKNFTFTFIIDDQLLIYQEESRQEFREYFADGKCSLPTVTFQTTILISLFKGNIIES